MGEEEHHDGGAEIIDDGARIDQSFAEKAAVLDGGEVGDFVEQLGGELGTEKVDEAKEVV